LVGVGGGDGPGVLVDDGHGQQIRRIGDVGSFDMERGLGDGCCGSGDGCHGVLGCNAVIPYIFGGGRCWERVGESTGREEEEVEERRGNGVAKSRPVLCT
jgi:hypothetical protein